MNCCQLCKRNSEKAYLVHERGRINRNFAAHAPVGMLQSICYFNLLQLLHRPIPETTTRICMTTLDKEDEFYNLHEFAVTTWATAGNIPLFIYLNAPPDAVRIIRLNPPSGRPWIHWHKTSVTFLSKINNPAPLPSLVQN